VTADTIYALSSGSPPAAIALIRISGPRADAALEALAGRLPEARRATLGELRDPASGEILDRVLFLRFPGPNSATGEDIAELHLHGGRAVVSAVLKVLGRLDGLRAAEPGEFTRRAFENGRMDLAEAEGLADLLSAETQSQRRAAAAMAGGALSRLVEEWRQRLLSLSAAVEACLDFSDEGEVGEAWPEGWSRDVGDIEERLQTFLSRPSAERLRDGIRVAVAGPPNCGKSSLVNHLAGRDVAITSAREGTTRDLLEAPVAIGGLPFILIDTAGLRETGDEIESIGIDRARAAVDQSDLVLWLGDPAEAPSGERTILVGSKCDLAAEYRPGADIQVSSLTGEGMTALLDMLSERVASLLPGEGEVTGNRRQRQALSAALGHLREAGSAADLLIAAEALRQGRSALDEVTGRAGVEDMLDALFGRFCIGK
jgi:tRNA modification GTPase